MMVDPHPLQNRLIKPELISDPIYCPHKFMDDHLTIENTSSTMIVKRTLKKSRYIVQNYSLFLIIFFLFSKDANHLISALVNILAYN